MLKTSIQALVAANKEKIEEAYKHLNCGQTGEIKREMATEDQPYMCGFKTKQVPRTFYKSPHINIFDQQNLMQIKSLDVSKKKLIIYNPSSGRKVNIRPLILQQLTNIEVYESKGYLDALNHVKLADLNQYSCVVAVGGDGTIHEVINGMLMRNDGKRLPIGLLPNGSGNDTCGGLLIDSIYEGLQYINKGDIIELDVVKVILDHEKDSDIQGPITNYLRYSIINSGLCLTANCAKNAVKYKRFIGKHAYSLQTVIELMKMRSQTFDYLIDDSISIQNYETQFILVYNGKFGGGRMILNPLAIINDGYFEFLFYNGLIGFASAIKLFDGAKSGGIHIYDPRGNVYRAKKLRVTNKSEQAQDINIDGEDLTFKKFVQYECIHKGIEVICDFEYMVNKNFS